MIYSVSWINDTFLARNKLAVIFDTMLKKQGCLAGTKRLAHCLGLAEQTSEILPQFLLQKVVTTLPQVPSFV